MVGQMLMAGFRGTSVDPESPVARDLLQYHLGGVILFSHDVELGSGPRNIENPAQLQKLTWALQTINSTPLFIAVDQEGGLVQRLNAKNGFRETDSAAILGQVPDDLLATMAAGLGIGKQLSDQGINIDFAPVLDVNVNPDCPAIGKLGRSFSADPKVVAEHGKAFIDMLHEGGVLSCVKHFPGHGSSTTDSHLGLPDVTATWTQAELAPFTSILRSGRADMVMTAHLFNTDWDPDHPASLSRHVITGMLRKSIGFEGVVVTDDLNMRAITDRYGLEEAIFLAINAGCDILLFGNNLTFDPDIVPKAHAIIMNLVATDRISPWRILQSWRRINALKTQLNPSSPLLPPDTPLVPTSMQ
ncbi:MAG: glycoside hydrolase family 3 protein [Proteobacteria bacterium]|nr:glycoside hydrolase family 3 protein [Pseudomonadota bacterium]MBU1610751.1 glycoside hydrolase family 3 protein [Pseudomonadota bacterium]